MSCQLRWINTRTRSGTSERVCVPGEPRWSKWTRRHVPQIASHPLYLFVFLLMCGRLYRFASGLVKGTITSLSSAAISECRASIANATAGLETIL